jgi:1-hydroxycarotenoid 3,4-desaturase
LGEIAIIGAGVGGLSAAALLAAEGHAVRVYERARGPGGKMRVLEVEGAAVDAGPTVLTMRWVFEALFDACGRSLSTFAALEPLPVLARHAWTSGGQLDLFADLAASEAAVEAFAGPDEAARFARFSAEARRIFTILRGPFLEQAKPNLAQLIARIGPLRVGDLLAIRPYETLWGALGAQFRDPRLRQLFARYATYAGSSPFACPATLMLIAHVEREGVWSVRGGMHALARALEALGRTQGVEFYYEADAAEILVEGGRAAGLRLADGSRVEADAVVFNGDPAALGAGLLGSAGAGALAPIAPSRRSLSAYAWALHTRAEGFALDRHNVFFARDYRQEFADMQRLGRPPAAPTVYICAQDRGAAPTAAGGRERMLLLVNAPAAGDMRGDDVEEIEACKTSARAVLAQCGLRLPAPLEGRLTTPAGFAALFPGSGGALYGQASHGWWASFRRPGAETALPGLFLAGGGTHPGAGAPMAALSGRLAAQAATRWLIRRPISRSPRPPAATSGGISTPSAQTAPTG